MVGDVKVYRSETDSPLTDGYRLIFHRYSCLYVAFLYLSGFNHRCKVATCWDMFEMAVLFGFSDD